MIGGGDRMADTRFYELLLDSFAYPLYVIDIETHKVIYANRAVGRIDEPITCHQLTHQSPTPCRGQHECPIEIIKTSKKAVISEHLHFDGDGRERYVEVHAHPIFDEHGNVGQIIEYSIDVTSRKEAEASLRDSEERFRLLSSSALDAIIMMDQKGKVAYWNSAAVKMFGYEEQEVIGRDLHALLAPKKYLQSFEQAFVEYIRTGDGLAVGKTLELEACHKDRSVFPISLSLSVMKSKGEWLAIGIIRDITEQKNHQREVESAFKYQKLLVDTAATAIFTVDERQIITDVNPAFTFITGFNSHEVIGRHCDILRGVPCCEGCGLFGGENEDRIFRRRCQVTTRDGRVLTILKNAEILTDDFGEVIGGVESFVDVTELTDAIEQAEAAKETRSEFLANMSHEIRTPMNGIIGLSGLLLDTKLSEEQLEFVTAIRSSADSLLAIINDILDFSKIDAGHLQLDIIPFDIRYAVYQTAYMVAQRAHQKGLELIVDIDEDVPLAAKGDPGRIKQILLNLLTNAVKFTDSGTVTIHLSSAGNSFRFETVDSGIGIAFSQVEKLFNPFVQADSSTTRKYGGTGLGLSISKRLVELMGGTIGAEQNELGGATFWFELTLGMALLKDVDSFSTPIAWFNSSLSNKRILIVDGHIGSGSVVSRLLQSWDFNTTVEVSPKSALELIRNYARLGQPFDALLLDTATVGTECENSLAELINDIPTILLTTFKDDSAAISANKNKHVIASIIKPVDPSRLYNELVTLFLKDDDSERVASSFAEEPMTADEDYKGTILVAEDNLINSRVACAVLDKLGYKTTIVKNGREACAAFQSFTFDLILMDVQMPEMDGLEATKTIKGLIARGKGKDTPIIAMTAHAMDGDRERCIESGMDDYISKPISRNQLLDTLERWLKK